jgi:hypothetical protein
MNFYHVKVVSPGGWYYISCVAIETQPSKPYVSFERVYVGIAKGMHGSSFLSFSSGKVAKVNIGHVLSPQDTKSPKTIKKGKGSVINVCRLGCNVIPAGRLPSIVRSYEEVRIRAWSREKCIW